MVTVYVDDLFVTGTCKKLINEFKARMSSKFDVSDLGMLTYYLGIEVCQRQNGISFSQRRYAIRILEEAIMDKCNLV